MTVSGVVSKRYHDRAIARFGPFGQRYYAIVYAIKGAELIKFGRTVKDVGKRLGTLQTGSPVPLALLGYVWLPDDAEADIHSHLKEHRSHGEWYFGNPPVLEVAEMIAYKEVQKLAERVGIK